MLSLCKPLSSKKRFAPFRKLNKDFSFTLFEKASAIPENEWEKISKKQSIYLEKEYLRIIEQCGHSKLICRYVIVYHHQTVVGIIYFQVIDFKAEVFGDIMSQKVQSIRSHRVKLFEKYLNSNKDEILMRLFTCGNNLISGEYGFIFDPKLKKDLAHSLLLEITELVAKEEKLRGTISAILIKDFYETLQPKSLFEKENYSEFLVEPNMLVEIPEDVKSLEDYVALFSKKYRKRAKTIFNSFADMEVRELDLKAITKYEKEMYALYSSIFENAKFKLLKLPENYFAEVKKIYPDTFYVKGFFLNGELLAFGSCFVTADGTLEAHYIGFNYALNVQYNLYQNLLYQLINEAIRFKCKTVNLGRTASEIKTTVGAKPHDLLCYIKPQNTISKLIQKPFISFLQPAAWTARNPFKEETLESKEV